jgi:hypothetical protein
MTEPNNGMIIAGWSFEIVSNSDTVDVLIPKCNVHIRKMIEEKEYESQLLVEFVALRDYHLEIEDNKETVINIKIEDVNMISIKIGKEEFDDNRLSFCAEELESESITFKTSTLLSILKLIRTKRDKIFSKLIFRCNFNDMNEIFTTNFVFI